MSLHGLANPAASHKVDAAGTFVHTFLFLKKRL